MHWKARRTFWSQIGQRSGLTMWQMKRPQTGPAVHSCAKGHSSSYPAPRSPLNVRSFTFIRAGACFLFPESFIPFFHSKRKSTSSVESFPPGQCSRSRNLESGRFGSSSSFLYTVDQNSTKAGQSASVSRYVLSRTDQPLGERINSP